MNPVKDTIRELTGSLLSLALVGGVLYLIYRRITADATAAAGAVAGAVPSLETVTTSAAQIARGLPSALGSALRGEDESGYITREEQTARAQAALARKKLDAGVAGG